MWHYPYELLFFVQMNVIDFRRLITLQSIIEWVGRPAALKEQLFHLGHEKLLGSCDIVFIEVPTHFLVLELGDARPFLDKVNRK